VVFINIIQTPIN